MTKAPWLLVVVFSFVLVSTLASAQGTDWESLMTAGVKAYQQGRYADAEKSLQDALKEAKRFGAHDRRLAISLHNLAALYQAQGKYVEAEPLYKRALGILEKALGLEHPNLTKALENYADLLRKMKRSTEAAKMEAHARAIRAKHVQENPVK